ncbi:MAG TPA: arginine--tRNA ligase, partial [Myxococcota bacterium]
MKDLVVTAVTDTLEALKAAGTLRLDNGVPAFAVEPPKQAAHGDFAVNVAMVLQKLEGKPPRAIAEAVVGKLTDGSISSADVIASAEIAGPGFINLRLRDKAFHDVVGRVAAAGEGWGRSAPTGKKV